MFLLFALSFERAKLSRDERETRRVPRTCERAARGAERREFEAVEITSVLAASETSGLAMTKRLRRFEPLPSRSLHSRAERFCPSPKEGLSVFGTLTAIRKAAKFGYRKYGLPGAIVAGVGGLVSYRFVKRKLGSGRRE